MTTETPDGPDSSSPAPEKEDHSAALAGSSIATTLRRLGTHLTSWVRNSSLYQWFTTEPDPDVIVIDLRDTWTVGPFLRILDWVTEPFIRAAADSWVGTTARRAVVAVYEDAPLRALGIVIVLVGLGIAGSGFLGDVSTTRLAVGIGVALGGVVAMRDDRNYEVLRETRPVTLIRALLEPPASSETSSTHEMRDSSQDVYQREASAETDTGSSPDASSQNVSAESDHSDSSPQESRASRDSNET